MGPQVAILGPKWKPYLAYLQDAAAAAAGAAAAAAAEAAVLTAHGHGDARGVTTCRNIQ